MMLSSRRILKHHSVSVDTENKIIIDPGFMTDSADDDSVGSVSEDPQKREKDAIKSAANLVKNAERQAEEIINNAHAEAENKQAKILQDAEAEARRVIDEARDSGYKEGIDNATSEGDVIKAEARQVLDDAHAEHKKMQESLEPEIVEMIIGITEKLLGNITKVNPKTILNIVKQGFAAAAISGDVTVYVSADDYENVLENKDELLALTDGSVKLQITKDLSLSPMDCVIETPFGDIDCSLGQQFESLRANLTYILNNK